MATQTFQNYDDKVTIQPVTTTNKTNLNVVGTTTQPTSTEPVSTTPAVTGTIPSTTTTATTPSTTATGILNTPSTTDIATVANPASYTAATTTAQGYDAAQAEASQYEAGAGETTKWGIDKNQLVAGQITGLIDANSPLMQQAETSAKQQANKAGLLNTSMAVGAAQGAVIGAALPIAQQDANTYAAAGQFNAAAANTMEQANIQAANAAAQFNAATQTDISKSNVAAINEAAAYGATAISQAGQFNADAANKASQYNIATATQIGQFNAEQLNKMSYANLDAQTQETLNASKNAAAMYDTYQQSINQILNSSMDVDSKQAAINLAYDTMIQGVGMYADVTGLNLDSILAGTAGAEAGAEAGATSPSGAAESPVAKYETAQEILAAEQAKWDADMDAIQQEYATGTGNDTADLKKYNDAIAALGPRPA